MLQLKEIVKEYLVGDGIVSALKGVTIDFRKSEFVAVLGPSGCGKTTLLNIVGGLDSYTSGDLIIKGRSTKDFKDSDWDTYRNHSVGFVFQSYNLIPHQSVLSNVELALQVSGMPKSERRKKALVALEKVGLSDQIHKKPTMMSGGQMQRVAIARALVNDPDIILADEPTGALDSETSVQIMDLLKEVASDRLVIMVTHNSELADHYATRIIRLRDGVVTSDSNHVATDELIAEQQDKSQKRAKLGFLTALGLSMNNLLTKKGRTFLTAFAGAIGIIGIALILALSSGMNNYIDGIESDTMGSYPIELEKESLDIAAMMSGAGGGSLFGQAAAGEGDATAEEVEGILSNNVVAESVKASESVMQQNNLGEFKAYLDKNENLIEESLSAIEYGYDIVPQVFRMDAAEKTVQVSPSTLSEEESSPVSMGLGAAAAMGSGNSVSSTWSQLADNPALREHQYELVEGTWPTSANEVALVIDANNEVSDYTLYMLGLLDIEDMDELVAAIENGEEYEDSQMSFSYDEALGLEFKVFGQSELYKASDDGSSVWIDKSEDAEYLASIFGQGLSVSITGVLKATEDAEVTSGVVYTGELSRSLLTTAAESTIVGQQLQDPTLNVFTGELFEADEQEGASSTQETETASTDQATVAAMAGMYGSPLPSESSGQISEDQLAVLLAQMSTDTPSTYEDVLSSLGYADVDQPSTIALYPTDFDGKTAIQTFITDYNNQVSDDADKVTYTDIVGTMTSSISSIVDIVSYILIAFVAISLIVSSIMIAIITYISVLERTKEIGILRAIGASKRDISNIFSAETVIEGLFSGVIGICVALLLCIPINAVISSMFGAENIASLPLEYSLVLIAISVLLNLVAGFIPSRMAAKKDPVEALRSE